MKRFLAAVWITIILYIVSFLMVFCVGKAWLTGVLWLLDSLCLIYLLITSYRQKRIMEFMFQEKKKREGRDVAWNEEEAQKLEIMKKRVELYTLQSQINPHFLYNTLDSIRSKALLDGNREIASMTEVLSKFFRYCISHEEGLVQIREEINHILDYYYIQKYRFEDRFDMEVEIENENIYDFYIPKMTLQPLVENAMIHGLEKVSRKGMLTVRMYATEKKVTIIISDNGVGMDIAQLDEMNRRMEQMLFAGSRKGKGSHNSIAVTNVNARIKITFGDEYGIRYRSMVGEGTDAVVSIPRIDDFTRIRYEEGLDKQS
ncbi:MAG: histidine kinase [Eubacterium sp.]|nr:histidine kinase [Eubacterium sp.]